MPTDFFPRALCLKKSCHKAATASADLLQIFLLSVAFGIALAQPTHTTEDMM